MGTGIRLRRMLVLTISALMVGSMLAVMPAAGAAPLFGSPVAYASGSWPQVVGVVDADDDGRLDVLVATAAPSDNQLLVHLQQEDGTLALHDALPIGGRAGSIATGDLTGDGIEEIAVAVRGVGIEVFRRYAPGGYDTWQVLRTPDDLRVRIADLNGNGLDDLVSLGWGTGTVTVHHRLADGGFGEPQVHAAPHSGYDDLEVGDVTGNGLTDVVVMSGQLYATPNLSVLRQTPNGVLQPASSYSLPTANTLTNGIGVGDVTGDGVADVIASFGGNRPSSGIAVFASDGWDLADAVTRPSYDRPQSVVIADVDGDGLADVTVLHGGWQRVGVYRQTADGQLAAEELFPIPYASQYSPHGLAVADVTSSGRPDLIIADYNHGLVIVPNTGGVLPPPETGRAIVATPEVAVTPDDDVATVVLERVDGSDGVLEVPWATFDGTAKAGTDYVQSSGTVTFGDGVTSRSLSVPIIAAPGPGDETSFTVVLAPASGEPTDDEVATITIVRPAEPTSADLAVGLTTDPGSPQRGEVFTVVATATAAHGTATDPQLAVEIDGKVDVVAIRTVGCDGSGHLSCRRDSLSPGAAMRVEIDLLATRGGWVDAIGSVSATSDDPNPDNDLATLRFRPR